MLLPDDNEKGLEPSSSPQASFRDVPLRTCGCWSGPIYLLDNVADHEQSSLCTDTCFFSGSLVHEARRHHPQSPSSHWLLCLLLPVSPRSDNSQVLQQDCVYGTQALPEGTMVGICPFCLTTTWISVLCLEKFLWSRALFPYIHEKHHIVSQTHTSGLAIPPTKWWTLCLTMWLALANEAFTDVTQAAALGTMWSLLLGTLVWASVLKKPHGERLSPSVPS